MRNSITCFPYKANMQIFPSLAKANGIAPNYINLIESRLQELTCAQ